MDKALGAPKPNNLYTTNDIKLMIAPKSYKAQEKFKDPLVDRIVNSLGSSLFSANDQETTTL